MTPPPAPTLERASTLVLHRAFLHLAVLTGVFLAALGAVQLAIPAEPRTMGLITLAQAAAVLLVRVWSGRRRPTVAHLDLDWSLLILCWGIPLLGRAVLDDSPHHLYLFLPTLILAGAVLRGWTASLVLRIVLLALFGWAWHLGRPVHPRASSLALNAAFCLALGIWVQYLVVSFRRRIGARMARLAAAGREIRTLEGLVPICMHCKKVRNDTGFWEQVDAYFRRRHHTAFTHGLCPTCLDGMRNEVQDL